MKSGVDGGPCRGAGDRWDERMVVPKWRPVIGSLALFLSRSPSLFISFSLSLSRARALSLSFSLSLFLSLSQLAKATSRAHLPAHLWITWDRGIVGLFCRYSRSLLPL
jgi:hypothetical protein